MERIIMDVPKWHVVMHRRERGLPMPDARDSPRMALEDEVFDRLYSGDAELLPAERVRSNLKDWALSFHQTAENNPRYQRLITQVRGDAFLAAAATESLMREVDPPDAPEGEPVAAPEPQVMRRRVGLGLGEATQAAADAQDMRDGLAGVGWDNTPDTGVPGQPPRTDVMVMARRDERLKRIALLAGKFKRIAAQKRRTRIKHGADEVIDMELGGDVARLLPAELAKLAHPVARLALMRDVLERQAQQYRLEGADTLGKGPMVVCLDKSGSMARMEYAKDIWATAVALALLEKARAERRPFHLIGFNSFPFAEFTAMPGQELSPDALFIQAHGGTDIGNALEQGLDFISKAKGAMRKADIVLISDGASDRHPAPDLRKTATAMGVTILGVGIAMPPGLLEPWCDEYVAINDLATLEPAAAEALFSKA